MVDERHKTEELTGSREGGTDMQPGCSDDGAATPRRKRHSHPNEMQKPNKK
jgi:hypothetical protein